MGNNEKVYSNVINEFSVRILYQHHQHPKLENSNIGSGVLVKVDKNTCYLITAKHNFKLKEDENYWNVDIEILKENIDKISVSNDNTNKVCVVDKLLYDDDNYDLLVFSLIDWSEDIKKLPFILIDKNLNLKEKKCFFYGYPDSKGTPSGKLDYEGHLNEGEDEHIFRLNRTKSVKSDALNGFSGSGIFVEIKNSYYLVGIFITFDNNHDFYFGIDLGFILDEITEKISNFNFPIIGKYSTEKQSHIIYRDGYIEPRTVYIKELDIHVAVCPVTFKEYDLFCEDTSRDKPKSYKYNFPRGNYPIINVSWYDAIAYCEWLSKQSNNYEYVLPNSIEWDSIVELNIIDTDNLDDYIWHRKNTKKEIKPVATTKKNGSLGIFDMYGNIHEWCMDNYDDKNKIIKGESFNYFFDNLDTEINYYLPNESRRILGFRIIIKKDS